MLGRDLLGQAQTGTGKTAAFALPLLARINLEARHPQVLVLAPTRELAIQVSEAFQRYASCTPGCMCCRSMAVPISAIKSTSCAAAFTWWWAHPAV